MQDQLKKLTLSNNKGKELLENLEKKYAAVKKQLEVFKSDIASAEENKEARVAKVRGEIQSLYSGITLFQLLFCIVVAFVAGLLFMKFFSHCGVCSISFFCSWKKDLLLFKEKRRGISDCIWRLGGIKRSNVVPKWNNGTVQLSPRQLSTAVFCAEYLPASRFVME